MTNIIAPLLMSIITEVWCLAGDSQ